METHGRTLSQRQKITSVPSEQNSLAIPNIYVKPLH